MKRFRRNLSKALESWKQDDGNLMAAAVAYYAALSFFPLLLVLISGLGPILEFTNWGRDAQDEVLAGIESYASTAVRDSVERMLGRVVDQASFSGPVGLLTLLIAAGALFANFDRAFDRIWNIASDRDGGILAAARSILFFRLRAFLMLLALGVLLLVNLAGSLILSGLREYSDQLLPGSEQLWSVSQTAAGLAVNALVFTLLYWIVPKVRVRLREALQGGLLASVIWEAGRWVLASLVLGEKYSAFGVIGSFLVVMLWVYYGSAVLFFGAEYVQVICDDCGRDT